MADRASGLAGPSIWQRMRTHRVIVICGWLLGLIALLVIVAPPFFPEAYTHPSALQYAPPSWAHPFGTDLNGRDLLYRVLTGTRVSLLVGLCGALISLCVGTSYGLVAGYFGGAIDSVMMRIVDAFHSIPRLLLILASIGVFNLTLRKFAAAHGWQWLVDYSSIVILVIALGVIEWLTMARIVRGQVLALKTRQFITAAQALGQSHVRILFRHLLPNLLGVIIIYLTLTIPAVIIDESFLSFLGLGIQAPQASLGSLLADGTIAINPVRNLWWMIVFPSAFMAANLLLLNFLGDALRDVLDPRQQP
jgi:peptide/nickel transport system permease protein/oligopeptide transport system permease protein